MRTGGRAVAAAWLLGAGCTLILGDRPSDPVVVDLGGDAAGDLGGDAADDLGGSASSCAALADRFDGTTVDPRLAPFADPGAGVAQDGAVVVRPAMGQLAAAYAGLTSTASCDLRGAAVLIEVPRTTNVGSGAQTYLALHAEGVDAQIAIFEAGGALFGQGPAPTSDEPFRVPYDAVAHRWWRIAEAGGMLRFQTSSDGRVFDDHATIATPSYAGAVRVIIGAGTYQAEPDPGSAEFDNLDAPPGS